MRTGSSNVRSLGHRSRTRLNERLKNGRKARFRWLDLDGLESRTLLATIPAATATGAAMNLTGLSSVTTNGNANSPAVVIDPYDSQKLFAVWSVDLSTLSPVPHHNARSSRGPTRPTAGQAGTRLGSRFAVRCSIVATINATPPTAYTQVTDPTVGFDGQDNVYVLSLADHRRRRRCAGPDQVQLLRRHAQPQTLPNNGIIYQWVSGSDAATRPDPGRRCGAAHRRGGPGSLCEQRLHRLGQHRHRARESQSLRVPASTRTGPSWSSGLPFPIRSGERRIAGVQRCEDRQCGWQLRPAGRFAPATRDQPERWRPGHRRLG